jgi:SAM-dependent methyltransferase
MKKGAGGTLVHEETYKGLGPASAVARRRLNRTLKVVNSLEVSEVGELADFGCSNGFLLSVLQAGPFRGKRWRFYGFDRSERLLVLARDKKLANTEFHQLDLNVPTDVWRERFDLVTCFETLEHTGSFETAVLNLYRACKVGGRIVISIPNEKGIPGLLKYVGRKVVRRNPYGGFFEGRSELGYLWRLISNQRIDGFRHPPAEGWGPHLGFDSAVFETFLREGLLESGMCRLLRSEASPGMFNHFFLLEKVR